MRRDEAKAAQLRAGNLLLPHDAPDRRGDYLMPDPEHGAEAYRSLYGAAFDGSGSDGDVVVTRTELRRVLALASGYLTLTTYELGQEHCVGKLRDIWRARRKR